MKLKKINRLSIFVLKFIGKRSFNLLLDVKRAIANPPQQVGASTNDPKLGYITLKKSWNYGNEDSFQEQF